MKIDLDTVRHVAKLAKFAVNDAEAEGLRRNLQDIVDYVGQIERLDLKDVPPMAHPFVDAMRLRDDLAEPCDVVDELLDQAPVRQGRYFKVPRIIGD